VRLPTAQAVGAFLRHHDRVVHSIVEHVHDLDPFVCVVRSWTRDKGCCRATVVGSEANQGLAMTIVMIAAPTH